MLTPQYAPQGPRLLVAPQSDHPFAPARAFFAPAGVLKLILKWRSTATQFEIAASDAQECKNDASLSSVIEYNKYICPSEVARTPGRSIGYQGVHRILPMTTPIEPSR
jgi:hypothetical protein